MTIKKISLIFGVATLTLMITTVTRFAAVQAHHTIQHCVTQTGSDNSADFDNCVRTIPDPPKDVNECITRTGSDNNADFNECVKQIPPDDSGGGGGSGSVRGVDTTFTTPTGKLVTDDAAIKAATSCDDSADEESRNIACQFIRVVNFLSIGVGVVSAITVGVSGVQYTMSRGDPGKTAQAVSRLTQVGLGIALYIFGWALLNWLVPGGVISTSKPVQQNQNQNQNGLIR